MGPKVITLCGSARFEEHFHIWNKVLTLSGHTVFALTAYPSIEGSKDWYTLDVKKRMDAAHMRKISASHAIFVINRLAYIGESTLNEIDFARSLEKKVYFLESWGRGCGIDLGGVRHTDHVRALAKKYDVYGLGSPIRTCDDPDYSCLLGPYDPYVSELCELSRSR